jgi:type II secretory pathway pseudopilin PulG
MTVILPLKKRLAKGFTLAEVAISMVLFSFLLVTMTSVLSKNQSQMAIMSTRSRSTMELESLFSQLRNQLQNMTWLDPTSHKDKLTFTTQDDSGNFQNVSYQIVNASGRRILQYSVNGSAWASPYTISTDSIYALDANSEFIYCGFQNDCTEFTDGSANGNWVWGESGDTRTAITGTVLNNPAEAKKVMLSGFIFTRAEGGISRQWPNVSFNGQERHVSVNTAPANLTSNQNVFTTQNANDFTSTFNVRGVNYDPTNRQLLVTGTDSAANKYLYVTSRDGVRVTAPILLNSISATNYDDVCMLNNGQTVILASFASAPFQLLKFNLADRSGTLLSLTSAATGLTSASAIACDSQDATNFYLLGKTGGGVTQIKQINSTTSAVGSSWTPGGTISTIAAMLISPVATGGTQGDFYLLNGTISGSGVNRTMSIIRVPRATPSTTDTFTINLANIGTATTSGTVANLGLAFDPYNNHIFLADETADRIYEFIPPRLLAQ